MSNNTIEIKVNSGGTLEVVTIPVKLYKDSYKAVKLRVKVPKTDGTILKVYGSDRDEAGEEVWTTSAYSLPYKKDEVINNQIYNVYEDYIPEEFCQKNGELFLTFSQGIMDGNIWNAVITSGTLNLYVSGEGFNYAGVEIPESDKLAYKVNEVFEKSQIFAEDIDKLEQDLSELKGKTGANIIVNGEKVDEFDADTKVDVKDLQDNYYDKKEIQNQIKDSTSNLVTLDTEQTISSWKDFKIYSNADEPFVLEHNSEDKQLYLNYSNALGDKKTRIFLKQDKLDIRPSNSFTANIPLGASLWLSNFASLSTYPMGEHNSSVNVHDMSISLKQDNDKLEIKSGKLKYNDEELIKESDLLDYAKTQYVDNNFISYTEQQALTEEQKQIARNNIGAGAGGGAGSEVIADSELNAESTNSVQNKVLYSPVSFADSERQKSKNLARIEDGVYTINGLTITANNGSVVFNGTLTGKNTFSLFGSDGITRPTSYYEEMVITTGNSIKLKAGTYTISFSNKSAYAFVILYGDLGETSSTGATLQQVESPHIMTLTFEQDTYLCLLKYLSAEYYNFSVSEIQIEKGNIKTSFQQYNGAIIHEKDIADVEHIEPLYDKNNGKTRLGSSDYGSGILGGVEVTGCDFSKYKRLVMYAKLGFSTIVYSIDLTFPNEEISSQVINGYVYCGGDSLANIDDGSKTSKSSCLISRDFTKLYHYLTGWGTGTTWNDRRNWEEWYIYKIEGVLK